MDELIAVGEWLELEVLFKLILATILGGLVGLERESRGKPAGFRTNVLIAVGATLFTQVSLVAGSMGGDPGRVAAQVASGVGFLGAGAVIQGRGSVTGLTTAASIWVVAAIGLAIGAGNYVAAIGGTVFVLITLLFLGRLERALTPSMRVRALTVETTNVHSGATDIRDDLLRHAHHAELRRTERNPRKGTLTLVYRVRVREVEKQAILERLASNATVLSVSWTGP